MPRPGRKRGSKYFASIDQARPVRNTMDRLFERQEKGKGEVKEQIEDEPVTFRFFQILLDVTADYQLQVFNAGAPLPTRILRRALITPDEGHHLCSAQKMAWLDFLDLGAEFGDEVEDSHREAWEEELVDQGQEPGDYQDWDDLVASYQKEGGPEGITFTEKIVASAFQGSYPDSEKQEAIEHAFANHLV